MATPPNKPVCKIIGILATSAVAVITDGNNNGAAVNARTIWWSDTPTPKWSINSDSSTRITGLISGKLYYVWAKTHNSAGWSPFSTPVTFTTLRVPFPPYGVKFSNILQTSVLATFADNFHNGGAAVTSREIGHTLDRGYDFDNIRPRIILPSDGSTVISDLVPGANYFFWARTKNTVGYSEWSVITNVRTIGVVFVTYGGLQVPALPYVKVSGVWRIARSWARYAGEWKETI